MSSPRVAVVTVLVTVAALSAACSRSSSGSPASSGGEPAAAGSSSTTAAAPATTLPAAIAKEPTVTVPPGPLPTTLQVKDLVVGTGPAAKVGDTLTVNYVGVSATTKKVFDSSWSRGTPFTFTLGGQVIPGWNQGLVGMRVGGRRQLIIPPQLAYGAQGAGGVIPPNDTLIFVVDLIAITPPS